MLLNQSEKFNYVTKAVTVLAVTALLSISIFAYQANTAALLIFLGFCIFYIQLPGQLILRIARIDFGSVSTNVLVGFFTGWTAITFLYFVSDVLHSNILLYAIPPLLSAMYIAALLRRKIQPAAIGRFSPLYVSNAFCLFLLLVLSYALLTTQFTYLAPSISDFTYLNADKAYHMGLIDSLSHDYPVQSPWVQGRTIHYHIFTELLLSIPVRLFDVPTDSMVMSCGPWLTSYTLCLSLYSFFKEFTSRKDRAGLYSLFLMLSNLFLVRKYSSSMAFHFAITNDNSVGYGIAGAVVVAIVFKHWCKADTKSMKITLSLLLTALVVIETGIKGPIAVVLVAAMWGTYILGLILRRVSLRDVWTLALVTIGFVIVYITILGSKGQSNGSGNSIIAFATIANIAFWKPALIEFMKSIGLPKIIRLAIVLFVFMLFMLTIYFVPFCLGYIRELYLVLTKKKDFDFARVMIYASAFVGLVAMFILNYSGHSQVYFGLVTCFFAPLIAYWFIEDLEEAYSKGISSGKLLKAVKLIFGCTLILTTLSLGYYYSRHIDNALANLNPHMNHDKYISISNEEYDAMLWIEENTEEDALLATDRYYSVPLDEYSYQNRWANRFFLYAVYSNRFCYIAGSGYNLPAGDWVIRREMIETNNKLYDADNAGRGKLARKLGVDYIVVSKRFSQLPDLSNRDYKLCYSNSEVDIYRVNQ